MTDEHTLSGSSPFIGTVLGVIATAALVVSAAPAHAGWPGTRGDSARSGTTTGAASLRNPVPYWRYYLGGSIRTRAALAMDIDGDDEAEMIFVSGGKLVAKERNNVPIWQTSVLGMYELVGVSDLDGDGAEEVIARNQEQLFVVEPGSGTILWQQSADDFGTLGGARIGDLDGDGLDDLFAQECACCRINNGNTGFVYSFADGYAAARKLWTSPEARCGGFRSMTLLDVDGDGAPEVTVGEHRRLLIVDGATGQEIAASPDLGDRTGGAICAPVDADGDGDDELLCAQNDSPVAQPELGHRVFLLDYGAGSLRVRWNRLLGDTALSLGLGPGYLNDLDGDGRFELAISALQDGSERTFFVDAESGVILEELADQAMVGVVELRPGETTVLTTADNTVHAWSFVRGQDIQPLWSLAGQRALAEPDWDAARTLYLSERMLAIDLDGDGVRELFAVDSDSGAELTAFDVSAASPSAAPQARARYRAAERESILAAWTAAIPGDAGRLVVAPSDGVMHVVDSELAPIRYGVRFGGYYPEGGWRNLPMTPVSADLGAGHDSVIVRDSSGALVRVDAPGASLEIKLDPVWHVAKTTSPLIIPNPTGQPPNVACRQTDSDGDHRVSMLDPDGQVLWSTALGGALLSDLVAGNLDGDGTPDVIAQWGLRSDRVLEHRALSGASGEVLWDAEPHTESTTRLPAGGAAVDWDGDGVDDYIHQFYETRVLSGVDGAVLARNDSSSLAYFMPSVADVDSDGRNEVILHGSYFPVRVLDDDFTSVMWQSPEDDRPYPYGSVVTGCSDGVVRLIGGSVANPSRLKITRLGGAEMGQYQAVVLAGGAAFASEEEATATAPRLGQLTSTSVHRNLAGDARPIAVVGSDDGWLYAIDGCTGALEFSVPFGASVGAVAFADSDGDGEDEIIVAVGDGYLYGLRDAPIAAPSWVIDTDPAAGITEDLDITERIRSLSAEWEPVVGADSYEVAVIRAETNEFMSDPPWQNVGEAHAATVTGLSLSHGERYTFVVRAISEDGRSPDAASDGIEVLLPGLPGGCDCQVGQGSTSPKPGPYAGLLVALALVLVGLRRRRR